ncbi:MAG: hypothetical protein MK110_08350 [Fuerstiella sp.]|nr:hypothetical protein [Fuerstiella sp.]
MGSAKRRYSIAACCAGSVLIWQLQNPYSTLAVQLIFAGLLLMGLIRWSAPFLLILIQLDLYLTFSDINAVEAPPRLIIAFFCVALLMLLSRLRSSQKLTGVRSFRQLLTGAVNTITIPSGQSVSPDTDNRRPTAGTEIAGIAARSLLLVLAAGWILEVSSPDGSSIQEYGLAPSDMQTLSVGLVLCAVYLMISLPFSEIRWRHLTPDQAGIYLRSRFTDWLRRDLRSIEQHRRRHRDKQSHRPRRVK